MQSCWKQLGIQEKESQSRRCVCRVWITRQICVSGFGSLGEKTHLKFCFPRFLEWIVMANNCSRRWHLTPQEEKVSFYGSSYPKKTKLGQAKIVGKALISSVKSYTGYTHSCKSHKTQLYVFISCANNKPLLSWQLETSIKYFRSRGITLNASRNRICIHTHTYFIYFNPVKSSVNYYNSI